MVSLRRHQLVRLSEAGWSAVLLRPWDPQARECLTHWAMHRLPLVVTRQPIAPPAAGCIALGLPSPARWDKRRLTLQVPRTALLCFDEFPRLAQVQGLLPRAARSAVRELRGGLDACRASSRVFGSYGWQAISGLDHVRPGSDLDLWISVDDASHADAVTQVLQSFGAARPRLDGELVFDGGAAVAWREWAEWRAGRARAVMVKRLNDVVLKRDTAWCERAGLAELVP
ncbi:malonate decarboxylase holo-[acyl-carrier-protein] synthase [Variovorax sp. WS11]|uniref:malonate decarboxylase holo-[acyl-carrier-protein] synthase n=1 Tax=Variovorax sp. WS11 TaxID=1105204 RepID=UPI000D0CDD9B|nr:malonate decarboxylase holo-[acyl-carrier-protein] synthase [Variovorax sp. WS11]NDZ18671.1 malonate decarboxylase holo-[acyl-carrier-protein] synthase [Variovorax sp. WS11]PSL83622.1 malonate decarboxylase holo-[acyl-carrier-protein] synthase [Variovorax sp. WS11]